MKTNQQQQKSTQNDLLRYAGLGSQILVSLGIAVFAGYKLDRWLKIPLPLFVWLLPLIVLIGMTYKLIKETSGKKNG
jgi:Putative F0F1-ATPase subunit Ca2+/Mg2+ transporter